MMTESLAAVLPVILILAAVAMGYGAVLVAAHAEPHLPAEDRFSIEIISALIMAFALAAAFAGGKVW